MKKNKIKVLVFPCGSEIGLEIHRSLKFSAHVEIYGANSIDDHGRFVYQNYVADIPFYNDPQFIPALKKIIDTYQIDAIYPAMDSVITKLASHQQELGCKVITSAVETTEICLSKLKTYQILEIKIKVPKIYKTIEEVTQYPVFIKPMVGYGSRGAKKVKDKHQAEQHLSEYPDSLICEYLPGKEFTVDCFTNKEGNLLFAEARERNRVVNGISVNTYRVKENQAIFQEIASKINENISFRGAWFFQVKFNSQGDLVLLEVASRLGGSSSLYRNIGVNFALLSVFDAFDFDVEILKNDFNIELDRALDNKYKIDIEYDTVYVDFDDCLILESLVNIDLIRFLYDCINKKKKLILITKHKHSIIDTLKAYKLESIFDEVIHLKTVDSKYKYMNHYNAIFIDDSHQERKSVNQQLGMPVFAPDAVESLIQ
ncbi:MAG: ATP-grasp domain-containing protein [Bacteroidetes bacterium]|nr:ATP-grasp domain-containing protein [Bacteroidota bacterium]